MFCLFSVQQPVCRHLSETRSASSRLSGLVGNVRRISAQTRTDILPPIFQPGNVPVSPLPQNRHTDASGLMCSAQYGQTFVRPLRTDAASSICRFEGRTRIQISPKIPSRHPTKNQPTPLRPFSEATTAQIMPDKSQRIKNSIALLSNPPVTRTYEFTTFPYRLNCLHPLPDRIDAFHKCGHFF